GECGPLRLHGRTCELYPCPAELVLLLRGEQVAVISSVVEPDDHCAAFGVGESGESAGKILRRAAGGLPVEPLILGRLCEPAQTVAVRCRVEVVQNRCGHTSTLNRLE